MNRTNGFTLLELMIVVVIIGILLGIALPSYQSYVLKSNRTEARAALLDIAARQERYAAQNNKYAFLPGLGASRTTPNNKYTMFIGRCAGGSIDSCYVITATANGAQAKDTDCLTITYDSFGNKGGTTLNCW